MDQNYYAAALKAGNRQFKESASRGESPYLPALDDFLPVDRLSQGTDLGTVQIPAEFIVGTKSHGRTHNFAVNYMPVTDEKSEFASKWKNLCASQLTEGIRDPIKAYEYLNRYYVEEGNKRVSVLKFFGAVSIPGEVTRILPERDQSPETELYYEFVDFYAITKVNFMEFTRPGSYKKFLQLMGREGKEDWDDEAVKRLRTDFYFFKKAFEQLGGERLKVKAADAMLMYMNIYGPDSLRGKNESEMKSALAKVWKEVDLLQEEGPVNVIEDPGQDSSQGLLSKIMPAFTWAKPTLKALFLYSRLPEHSDWVLGHEKGRQEAQLRLSDRLESDYAVCRSDEETEEIMRSAIDNGTNVFFATAAQMMNSCLKVAIDNPQAAILNCSLNVSHRYIRTYYPRMYEAKFISGAIAGAMCTNGRIGYINNYPVFGNIAEVNAFARGVQLSNSHAKVYLEWADSFEELRNKAQELISQGISLISVRNVSQNEDTEKELSGLQLVENGEVRKLVTPVYNWGNYYEQLIRGILDGSFKAQEAKSSKSLNYYWGMSSGVVGIEFSETLPMGSRYLGELIRKAIRMGVCRPFYDPDLNENGELEWHNVKASKSMEEIIGMDTLEYNIEGSIPKYEELTDKARTLVDVIGVKSARKDGE